MLIPEAAELSSTSLSSNKGWRNISLLDMGDPITVYDLAKKMIKLSGLTIKDKDNKEGDIEILTTGLRPWRKTC